MPTNKNAIIRYMYLDQLLSNRNHYYTRTELCEKCNERLIRDGYNPISKRTIELDLIDLTNSPFNMDIDDSLVIDGKRIIRYTDQTKSLFNKPLSCDEKRLLKEILNTLGVFTGVESFSWLQELREKLNDSKSFGSSKYDINDSLAYQEKTIISFEENKYLRNKEYLSQLFSYITTEQTIIIPYKKFSDNIAKEIIVFPYMLKQYNNRWYLLCTPAINYKPDIILNLPLDRFSGKIKPEIKHEYKKCAVNLNERFEDIVGITFYPEFPVEKIYFAVKNHIAPYIDTKPIHESQKVCIDSKYNITGYKTFCIECKYNHELLSTFLSFGDEIIILEPKHLREKIITQIKQQLENYSNIEQILELRK